MVPPPPFECYHDYVLFLPLSSPPFPPPPLFFFFFVFSFTLCISLFRLCVLCQFDCPVCLCSFDCTVCSWSVCLPSVSMFFRLHCVFLVSLFALRVCVLSIALCSCPFGCPVCSLPFCLTCVLFVLSFFPVTSLFLCMSFVFIVFFVALCVCFSSEFQLFGVFFALSVTIYVLFCHIIIMPCIFFVPLLAMYAHCPFNCPVCPFLCVYTLRSLPFHLPCMSFSVYLTRMPFYLPCVPFPVHLPRLLFPFICPVSFVLTPASFPFHLSRVLCPYPGFFSLSFVPCPLSCPDEGLCAGDVCQQTCSDSSDGRSFVCSCQVGYVLNEDQRTCRGTVSLVLVVVVVIAAAAVVVVGGGTCRIGAKPVHDLTFMPFFFLG